MSYSFVGFFVRPALPRPTDLPPDAVWRDVIHPFQGSGVHLPSFTD